jgi:hypothetical protein
LVFCIALSAACATAYHSAPADRPSTRAELNGWELTVNNEGTDERLAGSFAQALVDQGFQVVTHPAYQGELEVTLTTEHSDHGPVAVATLRSDGFFVDEARAPLDRGDAAAAWLAKTLAISQETADFVRNSGLPQQNPASPD